MNKKHKVNALIEQIKIKEGTSFTFNETELLNEYTHNEDNKSSITIKVLSIIGGLLATLFFMGFLFLTRVLNSEVSLLIFGILFIVSAIIINKKYDKLIVDTSSVALYIAGFFMIAVSLLELDVNENIIVFIVMIIALIAMYFTQSYMLSLFSVLVVSGSLLAFIAIHEKINAIHLYIVLVTFLLVTVFLNEAKIITYSKKTSRLYNPIRIGLVISFLVGLIATSKREVIEELSDKYFWISVVAISIGIFYVVSKIVEKLAITETNSKIAIYALIVFLIGFSSGSPAILGAILLVLLSFYVNFKSGLVIGIVALTCFVSLYYYDLGFTLLTKSILLFGSGVLFIILYVLINKKSITHEKI